MQLCGMKLLRILILSITVLSAASYAQSQAQTCTYCPNELVLSKALSQCYLSRFDAELQKARKSGIGVHMLNLTDCSGMKKTRAQNSMPDPREPEQKVKLDSTFLLPPERMVCLANLLKAEPFSPDEIVKFDLGISCD